MKNSKKSALLKFLACVGMALTILGVMIAFQANTVQAADGPKTYTITYNANGGTGAPDGQVKVHDVTLILPEQIPTREGYAFRGWSTTTHPEIIYPAGAEYTANRGAKFYAIWDVNEYTIRYNANGGYGAPDTQKKIKNEPLTLSSKKPYRKGYEFKGWSTTTHPDVLYSAGDEYLNNYGANFYAIWTPLPRPEDENGVYELTLSGNPDDHIITDRYYYVEGEKFVLLVDKDIDLPGDFADNVALIMDKLEELTGLSYLEPFLQCSFCNPEGPWHDLQFENKVKIGLYADQGKACGYSTMCDEVELFLPALRSPELLSSDPKEAEHLKSRYFIDYCTIAHELTHALTIRNAAYSNIMSEGIADYCMTKVFEILPEDHDWYKASLSQMVDEVHVAEREYHKNHKDDITVENAEQIFLSDYMHIYEMEYPDGANYRYGSMFFTYLFEHYGESVILDYSNAMKDSYYFVINGYSTFCLTSDEVRTEYISIIKQLFGEDVFTGFATWYQEIYRQNYWFDEGWVSLWNIASTYQYWVYMGYDLSQFPYDMSQFPYPI